MLYLTMERKHFRLTSIIIGLAVFITVIVQAYWNYQNYQINKEDFIGDVQSILDGSVELYYTDIAKNNLFRLSYGNNKNGLSLLLDSLSGSKKLDTMIMSFGSPNGKTVKSIKQITSLDSDSVSLISIDMSQRLWQPKTSFKDLAAKVIVSLEADSLKLSKIDSIIGQELSRNRINLEYELLSQRHPLKNNNFSVEPTKLIVQAKSSYLPSHTALAIQFSNNVLEVFKRGIGGILISFLTALVLIGALLYLYQTIKRQKELAEIKDDLISNITHEFKTPIATVMSAIEGIENFNRSGDPEKTKKYLSLSMTQLQKLNSMVEKLLETAAFNQDQIELVKEEVDIYSMVSTLVENYSALHPTKTIILDAEGKILKPVDAFHFENVISNLIDNALKYGEANVEIRLIERDEEMSINVSNQGKMIPKAHQSRVFEKFFRVPTGNEHDIKGYGIGLYYAKKVVEKHGGRISLRSNENHTTFEIII